MMEKEISETYSFRPVAFDEKGRRIVDGLSFRDVVKEYERDFHSRHSTEYALNLYANSKTMALLAKSSDAAPLYIKRGKPNLFTHAESICRCRSGGRWW